MCEILKNYFQLTHQTNSTTGSSAAHYMEDQSYTESL